MIHLFVTGMSTWHHRNAVVSTVTSQQEGRGLESVIWDLPVCSSKMPHCNPKLDEQKKIREWMFIISTFSFPH